MLTGGQLSSLWVSDSAAGGGLPSAGSDPPPNRLLKRSVMDCADAGAVSTLQPIAIITTESTAMPCRRFGRSAVMIIRLSPI